jgi:hypothetical protein
MVLSEDPPKLWSATEAGATALAVETVGMDDKRKHRA